ncbi:MAG: hypothetical protein FWH52_06290 [Synergistaceae bacterium]|nr:hypothetical protein [Synergistaceae bacterium]
MKSMQWSNSVRLWKGDNKTRLFPFNFQAKFNDKKVISDIDYLLSKKLLSGGCVDVSNDSFLINLNDSFEDGTLKYPKDDTLPALLEKEELILYIKTKFKE